MLYFVFVLYALFSCWGNYDIIILIFWGWWGGGESNILDMTLLFVCFFLSSSSVVILPEISFFNNTPTVSNTTMTLTVQFLENEGVQSSVCQLGPRPEEDCKITAVCMLAVLPECDKIVHGYTTNKYGFMRRKVHSGILLTLWYRVRH